MKGIKSLRQSTYKAMWSYCLKCSKYTENKIPQVVKAKKKKKNAFIKIYQRARR